MSHVPIRKPERSSGKLATTPLEPGWYVCYTFSNADAAFRKASLLGRKKQTVEVRSGDSLGKPGRYVVTVGSVFLERSAAEVKSDDLFTRDGFTSRAEVLEGTPTARPDSEAGTRRRDPTAGEPDASPEATPVGQAGPRRTALGRAETRKETPRPATSPDKPKPVASRPAGSDVDEPVVVVTPVPPPPEDDPTPVPMDGQCPACHRFVPPGAGFCPNCFAEIQQ
ncbi:MAG: zinc ribbon domain-containing protein [Candidatus Eremiobacterota bacterium]